MKYPTEQFNKLKELVFFTRKNTDISVTEMNPSSLHYMFFTQFSEGQTHNWFFTINGRIKRWHALTPDEKENATKLFSMNFNGFELYPEGCNDAHIETAVKRAIKETEA